MEEIKPIIRVDVGESEQTVKGLKKEISELKDRILNLTKGSDDYNDTVKQLQESQRRLNEVMALTKKEAVAVEGSYDALTHQMSLLKKEWRATADEAKRADLGAQIEEINQQLKDMDASVGNFQRNVGNYVSHWEGMPEVTKDFSTAMKEANQTIEPTKQGLEGLGNLASGLASGFAAAQGAAALLGVENEKLEQTFIKLQAAIALAQGMSGMKGLVEGAGKLSAVIGVSVKTLGLWGLAIAAVSAAFYALFTNLPSYKKQQEAYDLQIKNSIEAQENFKKSVEKGNEALEKRVALLKAQGVEEKKIIQEQINDAKSDMDKGYKNYQQADEQYRSVKWRSETLTNGAFKSVYGRSKKDALEHYGNLRKEALDTYNTLKATYDGYVNDLNILNEKEKTAFQNRLKNMEEALKSEETKLKEQYEKDIADAEKYGLDTTVITKKYNVDLKALQEKRKSLLTDTNTGDTKDDPNISLKNSIKERIKLETDATKRKLQNLETEKQKEIEIAYKTINDEEALQKALEDIEGKYAAKEYDIQLELKNKKLGLLQEWQEKNTDVKTQELEISQEIADLEVDIEAHKQNRLTEIAKQGNEQRNANKTVDDESTSFKSKTPLTDKFNLAAAEAKTFQEYWDAFAGSISNFDEIWGEMDIAGKVQTVTTLSQATLGNTSAILNSLADMYEQEGELSEKEQKKIKNLRIAGATIDMLNGAVSAFAGAMSLGVPLGPIVGAINAAAVLTMGGINIAKIKNTKVDGSDVGGSNGGTIPSVGSYASEIPYSYTRQLTGASEVDSLNQDTRVYILESDIQESNKKVQVRESESSF